MKCRAFVLLFVLIMLLLVVLPMLDTDDGTVCGSIRIPAAGVKTDVYYAFHGYDCGCCGTLWNGGKVIVKEVLPDISIYDTASLKLIDGSYMVLECVDIMDCLAMGDALLSSRGFVKANGDMLLCVKQSHWPFMRVYRLIRL